MPHRFSSLRAMICIVSVAIGLCFSTGAFARSESEIKAFYLYNFIKFVTWPDEPTTADIKICIAGDNPFSAMTDKLNARKVRNRQISVQSERLSSVNYSGGSLAASADFADCSVLFLGASEENFYVALVDDLGDSPVLTISDIDGFIDDGGMIGFIKVGNVVRFDINLKKARKAGLKMSAKLLELANRVEQ